MSAQQWRHTNSMKWQSPTYKAKRGNLQLNEARRKLCPKSPFWHADFDLEQHKREWKDGEARRARVPPDEKARLAAEDTKRKKFGLPPVVVAPVKPEAFGGKEFEISRSNVLCEPTIFCPQWRIHKEEIAPWPSKHEMEYEGDGRIATDKLHRRFPGLPRVDGNETVNWQHRAVIPPFPFEEFYYPIPSVVDIFMRTHEIKDTQFTDEAGTEAIGVELMGLLDSIDQW
ncbi:hypothetical protein LTR36_010696 [Oleoguttula mirabilis]|uniref:Uncharacterized protein n=1 Tax=Oleoguttula mirabilis TaxID=1507867 RepID=A0AAV9JRG2_9PEZI|nr:hypothetical protein LTR36_010696 [Oleoguttula mirabilis]